MMNILENKKKHIIYEDSDRVSKKLEKYLNHTITRLNKDIVCKIEVTQGSTIMPFDIEVYFLSGVGIRTKDDILNKAWDLVYNATGKSSGVYSESVDNCQEPMNLQESIKRVLKEETSLQNRLNEMIKSLGVVLASKAVGGFDNLVKILNLDLDDIKTQEMLVKNFIYHNKLEGIDILHLEINRNKPNKVRIKIHFDTNVYASNVESWVTRTMSDEINKFFPFKSAPYWEPVFATRGVTVVLDSEQITNEDDEDEMNLQETELTERCWKGYTQKGMKTMFGKRYPNCVKKKK